MPARLNLYFPDRPVRSVLLPEAGDHLVGRDPECRVVLDDDRVSRRHVRIRAAAGGWVVSDLGSKNGTTVDGREVETAPLKSGCCLSLGGLIATFEVLTEEESDRQHQQDLERLKGSLTLRRELTPASGLDQLLDKILASALALSGAERAFVMLRDSTGDLSVAARSGISAEALTSSSFSGSVGALERALDAGKSIVVSDTRADTFLGARPSVVSGRISSLACVPLVALDQKMGVLYLDSRKPGAAFSELDVEILEALAGHASLAVAVAGLDSEVREIGGELPTRLAPAAREARGALTWSGLRAHHAAAERPT